jgi:hypothetical protein
MYNEASPAQPVKPLNPVRWAELKKDIKEKMRTSLLGWIFGCLSSIFSIITAILFFVLLYLNYRLNTELKQVNTELKQTNLINQGLTFERDNLLAYKQQTNCGYNLPLDYQLNGEQLLVPMLTFVRNLPEVARLDPDNIEMDSIDSKNNIKWIEIYYYNNQNKYSRYLFIVYPSEKGIFWVNKACWIDPIDPN